MITVTLLVGTLFVSCDKNEYAPDISDQEFTVAENSPVGTIVGIVSASDRDGGQKLTFDIADGNANGTFAIDPAIGSLTVADPSQLDFETNTQFTLTVVVSDNHAKEPLESSASIRINVSDVNEYAPVIEVQTFSLDENPSNGQLIGVITATDDDIYQSLEFSIVDPENNGYFQIDPQSGALSVADSTAFDFETNEQLVVGIRVEDDHPQSLSSTENFSVLINDVFEIPDGQVAYYPFDGNADDASGNGYNGIIHGAVLTADRNGKAQSAYYFDGSNSYIDLGNAVDLKRYMSDYTVLGWIKLNEFSATYHTIIMSNRNPDLATKPGSLIGIGGLQSSLSKRVEYVQNTFVTGDEYTYDFLSANTQLELDTWYYFCITYEYHGSLSNLIKIYINGNLESQKLVGEVIDPENENTFLGCEPELNPVEYSLHGCLDEIEFYNRALTEAEIMTLYTR